jgi:phage repressor protein C with HTH and peptisase S24 domain
VDKSSNIKERILQIAEFKGIAKEKFFETIGMTYGNFKGKSKLTPINSNAIEDIITNYPEVDLEWLLTGRGNISKVQQKDSENNLSVRKLKTDTLIVNQDIPLYDVQVAAGVVDLFGGAQKQIPIDYIRIPKLPKCDGALYVTGDSMYPLLKSGDIVMYKEINNIQNNIIWGEMYLAYVNNDGNEYFFTKFIKKSEREGYVQFVSQNQHHQTVEFPITSIKALALVKASIRINSQL